MKSIILILLFSFQFINSCNFENRQIQVTEVQEQTYNGSSRIDEKANKFYNLVVSTDTIFDNFFLKLEELSIYPSDFLRLDLLENKAYEEAIILLYLKLYYYHNEYSLYAGDIENRIDENSYWLLVAYKYYKIFNKKPQGQLLLSIVINDIVKKYQTNNEEIQRLIFLIRNQN